MSSPLSLLVHRPSLNLTRVPAISPRSVSIVKRLFPCVLITCLHVLAGKRRPRPSSPSCAFALRLSALLVVDVAASVEAPRAVPFGHRRVPCGPVDVLVAAVLRDPFLQIRRARILVILCCHAAVSRDD